MRLPAGAHRVTVHGGPSIDVQTPFRLCLVGAPLDTGNLGVNALGAATLAGVAARVSDTTVQLFGHERGVTRRFFDVDDGDIVLLERGLWLSRRVHEPESIYRLYAQHLVGGGGNPVIRLMRSADAVWDISGGDSFSDIYGQRRFLKVALPKLVACRHAARTVLLPQTYGPFRLPANRSLARRVVLRADEAWARDRDSYERLVDLAGPDFDARRHRQGVDVAFLLPAVRPSLRDDLGVGAWFAEGRPVVGINVSGLLAASDAAEQFGLALDHDQAMSALVQRFLDHTDAGVALVPHVLGDHAESDLSACRRLAASVDDERVRVLEGRGLDAVGTKWAISQMAWITGARMHATIAALSTATPVTGIAYSPKMLGVFRTCGIEDQVVDARSTATADAVDALWEGYQRRQEIATRLRTYVPETVAEANRMFDSLLAGSWRTPR